MNRRNSVWATISVVFIGMIVVVMRLAQGLRQLEKVEEQGSNLVPQKSILTTELDITYRILPLFPELAHRNNLKDLETLNLFYGDQYQGVYFYFEYLLSELERLTGESIPKDEVLEDQELMSSRCHSIANRQWGDQTEKVLSTIERLRWSLAAVRQAKQTKESLRIVYSNHAGSAKEVNQRSVDHAAEAWLDRMSNGEGRGRYIPACPWPAERPAEWPNGELGFWTFDRYSRLSDENQLTAYTLDVHLQKEMQFDLIQASRALKRAEKEWVIRPSADLIASLEAKRARAEARLHSVSVMVTNMRFYYVHKNLLDVGGNGDAASFPEQP